MEEMKKKKYNPFKMWGSWAGLLVLVILSLVSLMASNSLGFYYIIIIAIIFNLAGINILNSGSFGFLPGSPSEIGRIIIIVFSAIIGFVIGWVINSIFRYINNKKI